MYGKAVSIIGGLLLAAATYAQTPDSGWGSKFKQSFSARVSVAFQEDDSSRIKVTEAWNRLMQNVKPGNPSHRWTQQYPLLSFVDSDQFFIMDYTDERGKKTSVVGLKAEEAKSIPTLETTLRDYLNNNVYAALEQIAREQEQLAGDEYIPDFRQLAAQDPYRNGLTLRVPDLGPFKDRTVTFTGFEGALSEAELAQYEDVKWEAGRRGVAVVARTNRLGSAIEQGAIAENGQAVAKYQIRRDIAQLQHIAIGNERSRAMLSRPVLGAVTSVYTCTSGCDSQSEWHPIYEAKRDTYQRPKVLPKPTASAAEQRAGSIFRP